MDLESKLREFWGNRLKFEEVIEQYLIQARTYDETELLKILRLRHNEWIKNRAPKKNREISQDRAKEGDVMLCKKMELGISGGVLDKSELSSGRYSIHATNNMGLTLLNYAAQVGNDRIVLELLHLGADTEIGDMAGNTPLIWAGVSGNEKVSLALLLMGANPNSKNYSQIGWIHLAVKKVSINMIKKWVWYGGNLNEKDRDGNTALHRLVEDGDLNKIEWMIEWGARLDIKNKRGETPLDRGLRGKNADFFKK